MRFLPIVAAVLAIVPTVAPATAADETADIKALSWLKGRWQGPGHAPGTEGIGTRTWTAPVEGVMSTTFQWHMPETGHVHYAFSVIETTDDGVILRFVHRGPDYYPFEDAPLAYRLETADENGAFFRCIANCRANQKIERTGPDSYTHTWPKVAGSEPPLTIEYRRMTD